nr:YihY/virulence factor BrkB family protein [Candidatus Cloacimonadota bacterium]
MNKFIEIIKAFRKKYNDEGIFKESAALTFVTLLGFIPFIIFIIFFLPKLPFLKIEDHFKDVMISIFLPSSAEQISEYVKQIAGQKIPFNLFNFIVLLVTSFSHLQNHQLLTCS